MQTSRQLNARALAKAGVRYLGALALVMLAAMVAGALTGCGGGGGADEVLPGQCYIAGQPADCTPTTSAHPVACTASAAAGGCR